MRGHVDVTLYEAKEFALSYFIDKLILSVGSIDTEMSVEVGLEK